MARELFGRDGYAATTLAAVAIGAGVSVQTVYFHFGNKQTVLAQVMDELAVGDDAPVPLLDRPWVVRIRRTDDPREAVALWLQGSLEIYGRVAPILQVVRDAAGSDPDAAEQWRTNQDQTRSAHRFLAEQLATKDALRRGLSVEQAADLIFTLVSAEVYLLLTGVCGWTPERWRDALTDVVAAAVLEPPPSRLPPPGPAPEPEGR